MINVEAHSCCTLSDGKHNKKYAYTTRYPIKRTLEVFLLQAANLVLRHVAAG